MSEEFLGTASWRIVSPVGHEYLEMVTELLQQCRLRYSDFGLFEAADLQWWWRKDQHAEPLNQSFVVDDSGPRAAFVVTHWGTTRRLDVLFAHAHHEVELAHLWDRALEALDAGDGTPVEMEIADGDNELIVRAVAAGFRPTSDSYWSSWLRAEDFLGVAPLREEFQLSSRATSGAGEHPMAQRNGHDVELRLRECSLYRAELDLAVRTKEGELAGYSLFWFDPVTLVGYVEPMRTEAPFERQGVARHMLGEGLRRLIELGATRLKVSSDLALYLQAGFTPTTKSTVYVRES